MAKGREQQDRSLPAFESVACGDLGRLIDHEQRVRPHIAFRVPGRILRTSLELDKFGVHRRPSGILEETKSQ